MNTNLKNKTFKDPFSLEVQDSKQIFNRNCSKATSALISQREISAKTNNSIKGNGVDRRLAQRKDTTPRSEVSIDFAAKQFFQILLVDIQYRSAKLNNDLEVVPVPFAGIQRKINI